MLRTFLAGAAATVLLSAIASSSNAADLIPYPNSGTYNNATYTFTAANTGEVWAYFTGADAGYENVIGMLVNGVSTGVYGLNDHTSAIGDSLDLGSVNAGDTIVFVLKILSQGNALVYSDPSMNTGYDSGPATGSPNGHNHIYSTAYTGTGPVFPGVPAGTYVAFEDLSFPGADYDHNDESFVFTNVASGGTLGGPGGVPEPATWAMMLLGFLGLGSAMRAARASRASLAA
jgi:hypothetical protein